MEVLGKSIKKEIGEQGGKERTYISVSSLTEKAKQKYKARELRNKNKGEDIREKWYLKYVYKNLVDFIN